MTPNVVTEWNTSMVYNGGDKVTFNKVTYQAKWWTQGEKPGNAAVWSVVK
ncbi:carbohydrate-binding protein [Carnobacterium maltaromaticum]|nr:carbohydrate-binding protein [Carnobacterium maltaromaticum]